MKTLVIAAAMALGITSAASADDFDTNLLTTTVTDGKLEFTATTNVGSDFDGVGDVWTLGAGAYVLEYDLGRGESEVFVFGEYTELNDQGVGTVGAEYIYTEVNNGATLEVAGQVAYVADTSDFGNGDVFVTPRVGLEFMASEQFALFGEVGYTWNASEDFAQAGGYGELGVDFGLTESLSLRPSVVKPFDTANDDAYAAIELEFQF